MASSTPTSTIPSSNSSTNIKAAPTIPPPVPQRPNVNTKRYSLTGNLISPRGTGSPERVFSATSPLAPQVLSISEKSWVNQKILLIYGQCGDPMQKQIDGSITIYHHQDSFPPTTWPVCDSHFKALVYLQPGPNTIKLDFVSPKHTPHNPHSSWTHINYLPLNNVPPLHLAIILAKDSPGTYDAVPERIQREGNGLETAIRKFRMAAYLWQAFTGEQMNRNNFGRRCFRYDEEWQQGTLTYHDTQTKTLRNEAKIHIIRSEKTVAEIRDLEIAQQYGPAKKKGDLFGIAMEAVKQHFRPEPNQVHYVSCMFLDSHWDPKVKTIRGHAALGGGDGQVKLAIFGSHALQSYPASIEEVVPAFSDCTRTDTKHVANDCSESGSNWEAANIGIGAHLHETGHLFGCGHQENGVMLRDYVRFNRTFTCREPFSTRTNTPGQRLCLMADECTWHRLDCLRFRFHPCFRIAIDPFSEFDDGLQVWSVANNEVVVTSKSGVAFAELFAEGDEFCRSWIEYLNTENSALPQQVTLNESDLRGRLPEKMQKKKLKVEIHGPSGAKHTIEDFSSLVSKNTRLKLPDGRMGFRGSKRGASQMQGSRPEEVVLESAMIFTKLMISIRVYHGMSIDGIEFYYEDGTSQLFGKRGGKPNGSEFTLDTRRGELLLGFYVRAGFWIDGIQIHTSLGNKSEIYGNAAGGNGYMLIPPRGYTLAGVYGSCGPWLDGFGLIITR
ncbi:hypothetical protein M501DRAFT_987910 [Patellaria atrata CBS 101060]|uniref:Jacalin-type lectin domain-containing protein n=1 Tax=Patellaria atrata CBS 101060 TaxID=1346257 RepID=A0A9P4S6J0_9PEZI|nr:hypothetical protein M501DRAFT_987910 [Patellaria atrata CBS 101060]